MAARKPAKGLVAAEKALADAALAYPEVIEEAPWGHRAFKVKKKTFLFMSLEGGELGLSTKLPHSNAVALELPFAEPTHYGLGKSGWVSASFREGDDVPIPMMLAWIDESYRTIAPKKLVADAGETEQPAATAPPKKKKAAPKKAAPKKKKAAPRKKKRAR